MPIYEAPCPPCKVIINGGFVAALAPILAARTLWPQVRIAATRLAEVAGAYVKMLTAIRVSVSVVAEWEGCEQAQLLMRWIEFDNDEDIDGRMALLTEWGDAIWEALADLANGKLPT